MLKGIVLNTEDDILLVDPNLTYLRYYLTKDKPEYKLPLVFTIHSTLVRHESVDYIEDSEGDIYTEDFFGKEEYKSISELEMCRLVDELIIGED